MSDTKKKPDTREGIVFPYPESGFFDDGLPKGVLSPSGFNTFRRCPRQFEYAYILGLRKPPVIAMVKGTAIHKGAEVVHAHTIEHGNPLELNGGIQAVSDTFDAEKDDVEDATKEEKGKVKDAAISNFRIYYRDAIPLIRPVAAEKPFAMKVGTVPFRGVIDLVDAVPGDYSLEDDPEQPPPLVEVVSDLKTTARLWPAQKLEQEPQLTFYAMAEDTDRVRVDFLLDQKSGCKYSPKRALRDLNSKRLLIEDAEQVSMFIKKGFFPRCDPTTWACTEKFCGYYADCRGPK